MKTKEEISEIWNEDDENCPAILIDDSEFLQGMAEVLGNDEIGYYGRIYHSSDEFGDESTDVYASFKGAEEALKNIVEKIKRKGANHAQQEARS